MENLRLYALSFVGVPYLWGGSNPMEGFDCSGFVQELLASVGLDLPGDQTAQRLYDHFSRNGSWNVYNCGSLAFYGTSVLKVTHVAMLIDDKRIIEASGGGSTTTSVHVAVAKSAFVRVRLVNYRNDLLAVIRPSYASIGAL